MERITGINDLRPNLTKYVEMVRDGSPVIITVKSQPEAVLVGYEEYLHLVKAMQDNKTLALRLAITAARTKAETAGITDAHVGAEVESVRRQSK